MSIGRQNPDYSVGDSFRDAVAVISAIVLEGVDSPLVDDALEQALAGTDHTNLTLNLGLLNALLLGMAAEARQQDRLDLLRQLAAAVGQSALEDDKNNPS